MLGEGQSFSSSIFTFSFLSSSYPQLNLSPSAPSSAEPLRMAIPIRSSASCVSTLHHGLLREPSRALLQKGFKPQHFCRIYLSWPAFFIFIFSSFSFMKTPMVPTHEIFDTSNLLPSYSQSLTLTLILFLKTQLLKLFPPGMCDLSIRNWSSLQ